jgi:cysteine synthase A
MSQSDWVDNAVKAIEAEYNRSADTHLIRLALPQFPDIDIYLKDESTHPTGSLKHRLARSLFLYALCNGWLKEGKPVVEASSGSTAISEAYFARLLGLPFIAVVPEGTAKKKIDQIAAYGGQCHEAPAKQVHQVAKQIAAELGGHFMDQFTYAERATDWRGNNNIAHSIYQQMACERFPIPRWIVVGAGTGGTSATLGRYLRYQHYWKRPSELCVVDPEHSVFYDAYLKNDNELVCSHGSLIEGIGRTKVEPSFIPGVVDRMFQVSDQESLSAMHFLTSMLGRPVGGSTGTNMVGVLRLANEMRKNGEAGSIVTLLCDDGARYQDSYYCERWLVDKGIDLTEGLAAIEQEIG